MDIIVFLLVVVIGSWNRRWFGGLFYQHKYKEILDNRGFQTACMVLTMIAIIYPYGNENILKLISGAMLVAWWQLQFWARGHHPIFSADKPVAQFNAVDWERYTDRWYNKVCLWVFPTSMHYGYWYSWMWVMLRYTCPMAVTALWVMDWRFVVIGALVMPVYLICDQLAKRNIKIFGQTDTELSEFIVGGIFFGGIYLLREKIWLNGIYWLECLSSLF